jgi:hypothetical protein
METPPIGYHPFSINAFTSAISSLALVFLIRVYSMKNILSEDKVIMTGCCVKSRLDSQG